MDEQNDVTAAPQRTLSVTGLWSYARGTLYMVRNPVGRVAIGHAVAPFDDETEEAYRERLRAAWPVKDGLMRKVMASAHVTLAIPRWRDGLDGDPLVKVFAQGLIASGFTYTGTVAPHPHPLWLCRMTPWCGNNGCEATHSFCLACYESMSRRTQVALARIYNPQQRFTGNAKLWIQALNEGIPDILADIARRNAEKTGDKAVHHVG